MVEVAYKDLSMVARKMTKDCPTQIAIEILKMDPIEVQNIYDENNSIYQANYEILARWKQRDCPTVETFRGVLDGAKARKINVPEVSHHVDLMGFQETHGVVAEEAGGRCDNTDQDLVGFMDIQNRVPERQHQNVPNVELLRNLSLIEVTHANVSDDGSDSSEADTEQLPIQRVTLTPPVLQPWNRSESTTSVATVASSTVGEEIQDPWQLMVEEGDRLSQKGDDSTNNVDQDVPNSGEKVAQNTRPTSLDVVNQPHTANAAGQKDYMDRTLTQFCNTFKQEKAQFQIVPGGPLVPYTVSTETSSAEYSSTDIITPTNVVNLNSMPPRSRIPADECSSSADNTPMDNIPPINNPNLHFKVSSSRHVQDSSSSESTSKNTIGTGARPKNNTNVDSRSDKKSSSSSAVKQRCSVCSQSDDEAHRISPISESSDGTYANCDDKCADCKSKVKKKEKKDNICQCVEKKQKRKRRFLRVKCKECNGYVSSKESRAAICSDGEDEPSIADHLRSLFGSIFKSRRSSVDISKNRASSHQIADHFQPL